MGYEIRYTTSEFLTNGEEKVQQEQEEKQEEAEEQEQKEKVRRFSYKRRIQSSLISNKKMFFSLGLFDINFLNYIKLSPNIFTFVGKN